MAHHNLFPSYISDLLVPQVPMSGTLTMLSKALPDKLTALGNNERAHHQGFHLIGLLSYGKVEAISFFAVGGWPGGSKQKLQV